MAASRSADDYLGSGWAFPVRPDAQGRLRYAPGDENVRQAIGLVLRTALGERLMRRDFGARVRQMVLAPGGEFQLRLLESAVRDALRDWEPRAEVVSVEAEFDPGTASRVDVRVEARVRATNSTLNLVYPFYLDGAGLA